MEGTVRFGRRFDGPSIPPIEENMIRIDAGLIQFGVEYRCLNGDTVGNFLEGPGKVVRDKVIESNRQRGKEIADLDDEGVSIHVFNRATGDELLRFDIFREEPHYHYFRPGSHQIVVQWDAIADPDFQDWVLKSLENRLAPMLDLAGASELAAKLDGAEVNRALATVRKAINAATRNIPPQD